MNTQKLDDTLCHHIDADLTHHVDHPLRDDVLESRYSTLQHDMNAANLRIACLTENLCFFADKLAECQDECAQLAKENTDLRSQIDATERADEGVLSSDDEASAWEKFIRAWLFGIAACVVAAAGLHWGII